MDRLDWRTYRDERQAPVPVTSAKPVKYRLTQMADLPDRGIDTGAFEGGVVLRTERELGDGTELSAQLLRERAVLIRPRRETDLKYVVARPRARPARPSAYRLPKLVAPSTALTPVSARPGDGQLRVLEAEPLGRGAFKVEPGHVGHAAFRVRGNDDTFLIDYDPAGGVVYAQQNGEPVNDDAPARLLVRQQQTLRKQLNGAAEPILDEDGRMLAMAERRPSQVTDERRLPEFDDATKWHAVGQAHYDASPIPTGHKWIIDTDADPEAVREAVRRTLPAGAVWRLKQS